jgi:hypothetical protein
VFFRNIQILIPNTWKANNYSKAKQESYEKVRTQDFHQMNLTQIEGKNSKYSVSMILMHG